MSKTVENSEIRVKEFAKKKLCYIEEQLQEIQICKKPNYKYQVHMHHNTMVGGGTNCLLFLFLIIKFSILIPVEDCKNQRT